MKFLIIFCVVCLGIDSSKTKENVLDEKSETKYAVLALGLALIVPVQFSIKHLLVRKYKGTYDPM